MKLLKKIGQILLGLLAVLIVVVGGYYIYLASHYYRIPDKQKQAIHNNQTAIFKAGKTYRVTTYNVGFGAYNQKFSFFMDSGELKDGTKLRGTRGTAFSKKAVLASTNGVIATLKKQKADFMLFQEIDTNSTRSYHVSQVKKVDQAFRGYGNTFASNFHAAFIALPLNNPHGTVRSGLLSLSKYRMASAVRRKYSVSSGPIEKFVDLDRCFSVMRYRVDNGKDLILINSHMSAYDKGGKMRKAQMKLLSSVIEKEYQQGNYVIVGGDFNHALGKDMLTHFQHEEKIPSWVSVLSEKMLPKGFSMVKATNRETEPTCRATDMAYDPKVNYMTICDGFIVSKNVEAKAFNINTQFKYADHNPVRLSFILK